MVVDVLRLCLLCCLGHPLAHLAVMAGRAPARRAVALDGVQTLGEDLLDEVGLQLTKENPHVDWATSAVGVQRGRGGDVRAEHAFILADGLTLRDGFMPGRKNAPLAGRSPLTPPQLDDIQQVVGGPRCSCRNRAVRDCGRVGTSSEFPDPEP